MSRRPAAQQALQESLMRRLLAGGLPMMYELVRPKQA